MKSLSIVAWALVLPINAPLSHAADPATEPGWIEDAGGCKFFDSFRGAYKEMVWVGKCVDGYVHGEGAVMLSGNPTIKFRGTFEKGYLPSGSVVFPVGEYRGPFKDNMPHGVGVWEFPNGLLVEGTYVAGRPIGEVKMTWPDGAKYVGAVDSKGRTMEGKGRIEYAEGSVYEGDFLNGKPHGSGTTVYVNGVKYVGAYENGLETGDGEKWYPDGTHYKGQFLAGKRNGEGTFTFPQGHYYTGAFAAEYKQGRGRFTYADGTYMEGEWKLDELNGACHMVLADGVYSGTCIDGERSGFGRYESATTKAAYDGEFLADSPHGKGRFVEGDYSYEGQFANGMKSGKGREKVGTGEEYEGEFLSGLRHGRGVLRIQTADGVSATYDGDFHKGMMHGRGILTTDAAKLDGEFKLNVFTSGAITNKEGRKFEVDAVKQSFYEVLPDGTKRDLTELELRELTI